MSDTKPQFYLSYRWGISVVLLAGLLTLMLPGKPAVASYRNYRSYSRYRGYRNYTSSRDYRACAFYLQETGISALEAAEACSSALNPRDLSTCTTDIDRHTDIPPRDALLTCRRVRRPLELGNCVVTISLYSEQLASPEILDNCRRSLLPKRFSDCTIGLGRETDLPVAQLMASCLDGRDRPSDFYPIITTPGAAPLNPNLTPGAPPPLAPIPGIPRVE